MNEECEWASSFNSARADKVVFYDCEHDLDDKREYPFVSINKPNFLRANIQAG